MNISFLILFSELCLLWVATNWIWRLHCFWLTLLKRTFSKNAFFLFIFWVRLITLLLWESLHNTISFQIWRAHFIKHSIQEPLFIIIFMLYNTTKNMKLFFSSFEEIWQYYVRWNFPNIFFFSHMLSKYSVRILSSLFLFNFMNFTFRFFYYITFNSKINENTMIITISTYIEGD